MTQNHAENASPERELTAPCLHSTQQEGTPPESLHTSVQGGQRPREYPFAVAPDGSIPDEYDPAKGHVLIHEPPLSIGVA